LKASRFVAKNTMLLTLGLFAGRVMALFVFRKVAMTLVTEGTGMWGTAVDISAILLVVANFGLGTLITREIVRDRELTLPILWAALRLRLLLGLGCYAFLLAYVHLTGFDLPTREAVLVMALGVILETTAMVCDSVLQAHEKVQYQTYSQIVSAVVYFALAWWWLDAGHGLMGVIWANVISRVARLAVMVPLMLLKTGPWRWAPPDRAVGMRWMMRLGLPMFLSTTFGIVSYKVDTVMLMEMMGKTAAGIYTLGHRALDVLLIAPNIFATALFPSLMRYGAESVARGEGPGSGRDVERMGERALRYLEVAVLPLTLLCMLTAEPVVRWFSTDPGFTPSIAVFRIVIWGLPLQGATAIFNRLLIGAGHERRFVAIGLAAMLANVGLNLFLIPRFGWIGAACATICSLTLSLLMHQHFVRRAGVRIAWAHTALRTPAALALAWFAAAGTARLAAPAWGGGWFSLPLHVGWGPFLAVVGLTAVYYAAALSALRVMRREDLDLLVSLRRS